MEDEAGKRLFELGLCRAQDGKSVGFMLTINSRERGCYWLLAGMKKWLYRNQGAAIPVALGGTVGTVSARKFGFAFQDVQ
jgi:hypothetical protein